MRIGGSITTYPVRDTSTLPPATRRPRPWAATRPTRRSGPDCRFPTRRRSHRCAAAPSLAPIESPSADDYASKCHAQRWATGLRRPAAQTSSPRSRNPTKDEW